jgi:hypothetical protein
MFSAEQYLEMARECMASAERVNDPERRKAFIEAARLYTRTALHMQRGAVPTPEKPQAA